MSQRCCFIKTDGMQCKLRTRNNICHKHADQWRTQQEQTKLNQELEHLKVYQKNVKLQISSLIEKRTKINSLKEHLEHSIDYIKQLEREKTEDQRRMDEIEGENEALEHDNKDLLNRCKQLELENRNLQKLSNKYDIVCKFEKMKSNLIQIMGNKEFDINEMHKEEYKDKIKEHYKCEGRDLIKQYWAMQKIRNQFCHPFNN